MDTYVHTPLFCDDLFADVATVVIADERGLRARMETRDKDRLRTWQWTINLVLRRMLCAIRRSLAPYFCAVNDMADSFLDK
jgi:hypothetical protein